LRLCIPQILAERTTSVPIGLSQRSSTQSGLIIARIDATMPAVQSVSKPRLVARQIASLKSPLEQSQARTVNATLITTSDQLTIPFSHLQVPYFSGAAVKVSVDGDDDQMLAFLPYKCSLKECSKKLQITCLGNRYNGFGQLHLIGDDMYWLGQNSWRTEVSR